EVDPLSLRNQPKQGTVAVETPGPAFLHDLQIGLAVPVNQLVSDFSACVFVGQLDGAGSKPLNADHRYNSGGQDAAQRAVRFDIFESDHRYQGTALVAARPVRSTHSCTLSFSPNSNADIPQVPS